MTPATLDLSLTRGYSWRKAFQLMTPVWVYKPITAVAQTAPIQITVPGHGLPGNWPVWLQGTTSSALNRDKDRQVFHTAEPLDADTLAINAIDGTRLKAQGGMLAYRAPVDLTGSTVSIRLGDIDAAADLTPGSVSGSLTKEQVAALQDGDRWSMSIQHADGVSIPWLCGRLSIHGCKK